MNDFKNNTDLHYRDEKDALNRLDWIADDKYRIWMHVAFWVFIYLDEILGMIGLTESLQLGMWKLLILFLIDVVTVYFNLYLLVPVFFLNNKILQYVSFTIITIFLNIESSFLVMLYSSGEEFLELPSETTINMLLSDLVYATFMLGTAVGANALRRFIVSQKKIRNLENTNLKTELKFLKNQINPHFLFNSLNNIYVQTRKRPEEASESVLVLSDILRYQLYDCAHERVKLEKEIKYLKNYLNLDKIRKSETALRFNIDGEVKNQMVAPYLFITFVENAVKHGLTHKKNSYIDIRFDIEEQDVEFTIRNSALKKNELNNKPGGIGLQNARRRLELIYPDKHKLIITDRDDYYQVYLKLNLN